MNDNYYLIVFLAECSVVTTDVFDLSHPIVNGLRSNLEICDEYFPCVLQPINEQIIPGDKGRLRIRCISTVSGKDYFRIDAHFQLKEGPNLLATCSISEIESIEINTIKSTK